MKMKKISTLLIVALFLTSSIATFSMKHESTISVGAGIGLTYGVNESIPAERSIGPLFSIYGIWNNLIAGELSPEISLEYFKNGTIVGLDINDPEIQNLNHMYLAVLV